MERPMLQVLLCATTFVLIDSLHVRGQAPEPVPPMPSPRLSSVARLANVEEVRQQLGLAPAYDNLPGIENIKIAVLDYGFDGVGGPRRYLPEGTVVVEHYDPEFVRRFHLGDPDYRKEFAPGNAHGRTMTQIIWAMTGSHPNGPKFYLLNANGPTMLRRAVRYAIEAKIDIILFSSTFEGGGNGDGRGPINRVVADALAADIIWINAAGNYGGHVYNGSVNVLPSGYLQLGKEADGSALRFRNLLDENTVTVTLTWNDYREQEDAGTDKDLDLYVEDSHGQVVGSSEKKQIVAGKNDPHTSRNPRERIVLTDLAADREHDYLIRVKAKGGAFTADDRVRVLITSSREGFLDPKTGAPTEAIQFLDASRKGEIYPPADNPLVLTVGDTGPESAVGPTADHRRKPDIILENSRVAFTNGDMTYGASNAAAYFAGVVTLLKAAEPGLRTRHLLSFAHNDNATRVALQTEIGQVRTSLKPLDSQRPPASSTTSRRATLGQRLANLASSASGQNQNGPLQIRAPYFDLSLGQRSPSSTSPPLRPVQGLNGPMRVRAGGFDLTLPPRSSSTARVFPARRDSGSNPPATGTNERSPELIHPPRKESETQPTESNPAATGTNGRSPELVHVPRKETETQPTQGEASLPPLVWRTPTRQHLAEVVRDARPGQSDSSGR